MRHWWWEDVGQCVGVGVFWGELRHNAAKCNNKDENEKGENIIIIIIYVYSIWMVYLTLDYWIWILKKSANLSQKEFQMENWSAHQSLKRYVVFRGSSVSLWLWVGKKKNNYLENIIKMLFTGFCLWRVRIHSLLVIIQSEVLQLNFWKILRDLCVCHVS